MRRMTTQPPDLGRTARERLADEVIETYVSWREECAAQAHREAVERVVRESAGK